jgi:hypothetical protein
MTRDPRLAHPKNLLQFRHRKLVLFEQKEEPEPRWIGEELEKING